MTNDITQVQNFISQFVRGMIRTTVLTFGSIYCMFRLSRAFGYVVLCAFPLILLVMAVCMKKSGSLFTQLQTQLDAVNSIMQEDVAGIRVIKACVREIYEKLRFGKANHELIQTQLRVLILFALMNPIVNALMYLAVAAILLVGNVSVHAGSTTPGHVMAAITYTTQLLNGLLMLVMLFQSITRGIASWKRVRVLLDSSPELTDGEQTGETALRGSIEFKDVSFAYPDGQPVLEHIDLKIKPGEALAIMGETGCGKTTLVSLIPRFYDVTGGTVLVDGVNVREFPQTALRDKIAIALQKSELFSVSVAENIAWGDPEAGEEEIKSVAAVAQADSFIAQMPEGYQTLVAERGMSLSGGQKQRVSIARAVLKNAEILIFDDSTSALDLKTEADLYAALREANPHSTKIIVAQRIASARQADRIAVLEAGHIVACGPHEELLASCPTYQAIYQSQMGEEDDTHE